MRHIVKKGLFRSSRLRIFLLVLGLSFLALTLIFSFLELPGNVYVMCGIVGLASLVFSVLLFGRETLWSLNAGNQRMQKRISELEAAIKANKIEAAQLADSLSEQSKYQELARKKNNTIILEQLAKIDELKTGINELENIPVQLKRLDAAIALLELNANVPPGSMDALRWIENHCPHGRALWVGASVANVERLAGIAKLPVDFRSIGTLISDIAKYDCVFLELNKDLQNLSPSIPFSWIKPSARVFALGAGIERIQQLNFGTPVEVALGRAEAKITEISIRRNLK